MVFYRYVSGSEARAIGGPGEVGFLRGGRPGVIHWTNERIATAAEVKRRLALPDPPEVVVRFTILSEPALLKDGSAVAAKYGEPGGGIEWMTEDRVEVLVEDVDDLA